MERNGRHEVPEMGIPSWRPVLPRSRLRACRAPGLPRGSLTEVLGSSGGSGCRLRLELELVQGAFGRLDVIAGAYVNRLVDAAALLMRIEVTNLHQVADGRDVMVRWNRDVAGTHEPVFVIQAQRDTAFGVVAVDDEGRALDELELQMRAAGIGTARTEGRFEFLEDNAFTVREPEFLVDLDLVVGIDHRADPTESREVRWNHHDQPGEPIDVATLAMVLAVHFQQVEGVERVAHGLAIEKHVLRDLRNRLADWFGHGDDQAPAVDAGDGIALLADHEPAAVMLFLEAMTATGEQTPDLAFFNGIGELAADAAVSALVAGLPGVLVSLDPVLISLGELRRHELVVNLRGLGQGDGMLGLGADVERVAAPTVGECNDVAFAFRLDGGMVFFVR